MPGNDAPAGRPYLDEIAEALQAYLEAVPRQRESNPPPLLPLMQRLEDLQRALPADAPERVRHYMFTKSYRKAWEYLQGMAPESGACSNKLG